MKLSNKIIIYIATLTLGIIITTIGLVSIINPVSRPVVYSDSEIEKRARELGMVDLKEYLQVVAELNKESTKDIENENNVTQDYHEDTSDNNFDDNRDVSEEQQSEEKPQGEEKPQDEEEKEENIGELKSTQEYIIFEINRGESSESVINRLFQTGIISNKERFIETVRKREVGRRITYGKFKLYLQMDYDKVIDILVGNE